MARRVYIESQPLDAAPDAAQESPSEIASSFVRALGWRAPPSWTEIDREGAIEVLSSALMNDLVDDAPRMPFREAEAEARRFIATCEANAVFLTNAPLEAIRKGFSRHPITPAKADAGVLAVTPHRAKLMWITDG